jgi:AcrR family transcriptional regulator
MVTPMARPKTFDTDQALDAAMRLFWERGFEATSVQDLVDRLGVNRASLYATFGDKAQLFDAVLDRYGDQVQSVLTTQLAAPHAGREAVARYLATVVALGTRSTGPKGCLLVNTAVGCATAPPGLVERVTTAILRTQAALHDALRRDPRLAARKDLRALSRFFAAQGHGLAVLARTGATRGQLEQAAAVALRVLDVPDGDHATPSA